MPRLRFAGRSVQHLPISHWQSLKSRRLPPSQRGLHVFLDTSWQPGSGAASTSRCCTVNGLSGSSGHVEAGKVARSPSPPPSPRPACCQTWSSHPMRDRRSCTASDHWHCQPLLPKFFVPRIHFAVKCPGGPDGLFIRLPRGLGAATPLPPPPRPPHSRMPGSRRRTVAGRSAGRLPPTGRLALHWHCGSDTGQWHRHHGGAQAREGPRRGSGRPRRGGADDIQACLALAAVDSEPETVAVKLPV